MNPDHANLAAANVLILEDDYYLATDLQQVLEQAGATVVGPFPDVEGASQSLGDARPDCAFVDVNLGDGPSFEVPSALTRLAIPFAFVTGYDAGTIPSEFDTVVRLEKPVNARDVTRVALDMLGRSDVAPA